MPFIFQIRPLSLERGFLLSCEGVLEGELRFRRLADAIVHAAQMGRDLEGEIHIYDTSGRVAEALPLHPRVCAVNSLLETSCSLS